MGPDPEGPIGYLVGRYPAASHAFLLREVNALRALGRELETISIRPALPEELRTEADREADQTTFHVLPSNPPRLVAAHVAAFARRPLRYLATLAWTLSLGPGGARGLLWQLYYFAEAMIVLGHCRRHGITRLHAQFADTATDTALIIRRFEREHFRWSLSLHGPSEFDLAGRNRLAEKLASADLVACASADTRERAAALMDPGAHAKLRLIRLGVDTTRFSPADGRKQPAAPASPAEALRVLCLGRLVPEKAQIDLVEAAGLMRAAGEPIALTLAGEGPERSRLEQRVAELGLADSVRFTGVVGQDEALELYRGSEVFCLPSRAEGLPVVLMEAMACALPVLTTPVRGIPELVVDERNGLLVAPGDPVALAAQLRRLAGDPALRGRLGAAGRETIVREFTLERQAGEVDALLGELLRGSGGASGGPRRGGGASGDSAG